VATLQSKQALYVGCCASIVAFALVFALPAVVQMRVPWYYPVEHRWALEVKATGLAMDWFGRCLYSAASAALAFGAGYLSVVRRKAPMVSGLGTWAGWAAAALALTMTLYVFQLVPRRSVAAPLPPDYVAR
jgi:hypothetical protein